ncbi:Arm DNA-binding domain-containing protein [Granulicella sp. WH15]|uniref:tyrosine-type recombinase/integrase n=1 Tax=Granulicella sp. WH15 TaxID=2602070 RepID=UPI001C703C04|nr:Arm DNA-binding domain-containing protein [Granulicella sp. WH15]
MKLTDTRVRNAKAGAKDARFPDGGGLYLLVTAAGGKLWRWKYRFEGKEKLMTFGQYPDVSLLEAREKHSAARKLLKAGTDPMAERKAEKVAAKTAEEHSLQSIAEQWHQHWAIGKSLRHTDTVLRRLQADVFPSPGSFPVTEIEAPRWWRWCRPSKTGRPTIWPSVPWRLWGRSSGTPSLTDTRSGTRRRILSPPTSSSRFRRPTTPGSTPKSFRPF